MSDDIKADIARLEKEINAPEKIMGTAQGSDSSGFASTSFPLNGCVKCEELLVVSWSLISLFTATLSSDRHDLPQISLHHRLNRFLSLSSASFHPPRPITFSFLATWSCHHTFIYLFVSLPASFIHKIIHFNPSNALKSPQPIALEIYPR